MAPNELGVPVLCIKNVVPCRIVERVNRFVVRVQREGREHRAWINNTGRLEELLVGGGDAFCVPHERPGKTDCRLFAFADHNLGTLTDTLWQMGGFEQAIRMGLIPWLGGCTVLRRNARLGDSLIDYLLVSPDGHVYVEVKSAALRQGTLASYPDCPSARGRKHVRELRALVENGGRGIIVFVASLPEVAGFAPNWSADAELCQLLVDANRAGVQLRAIGMQYNPEDSCVYLYNPDLEVALQALAPHPDP